MPFTLENARKLLRYDPVSGNFYWLEDRLSFAGKAKKGSVAGTINHGYVQVGVLGRNFRAHRLAWLFVTNSMPEKGKEIDHINGIRSDNRWCNLRLVNRSQNTMNGITRSDNLSGQRGVSWRKDTSKWHARICIEGKIKMLGNFNSFDEACMARRDAERVLFGEYRRQP